MFVLRESLLDIDIIMHSRKSLLFDSNSAWIKKNNSSFDVTMGSYDGAEFSTDWPTHTGKKVSDSTGTTGSQFSRTPQDHKQNESEKTSLDTSRTTDSRLLYRPT